MRTVDAALLALVQTGQSSKGFAFRFNIASVTNGVWCYTTLKRGVTLNTGAGGAAETYSAAVINIDKKEGGEARPDFTEFTLETKRMEPLLSFTDPKLGLVIDVTVYEVYFAADRTPYPDIVAAGDVVYVERHAGWLKVPCRPLYRYWKKSVPGLISSTRDVRMPWASDSSFGVDIADFSTPAVATSVTQNKVFSATAALKDEGYYARGLMTYIRTIQSKSVTIRVPIINNVVATSHFVCAYPPPLIMDGDASFTAVAGYDGTYDQSRNKFGNYNEGAGYIGFPWKPYDNPCFKPAST